MNIQNNVLDLIISLVLIYALLSILVSIIAEWWNHLFKARGKMLKQSIVKLLNDPLNFDYGDLLYNHYLISGLKRDNRPPQYISSSMFAEALIDVIANQSLHCAKVTKTDITDKGKQYTIDETPVPEKLMDRFALSLKAMKPSPFTDAMQSFYDKSGKDNYDGLKKRVEAWYNDYMDRVTGWYKTKQRWKLVFFGLAVAIGLNVDSIHLAKMLSLDDKLRDRLVAVADETAEQYKKMADSLRDDPDNLVRILQKASADPNKKDTIMIVVDGNKDVDSLVREFDEASELYRNRADSVLAIASSLDLPIGWNSDMAPASWWCDSCSFTPPKGHGLQAYLIRRNTCDPTAGTVFIYWLGIFITGISLSFGAPFWFELLVKLVNIRRAGAKPPTTPKENAKEKE